MLFRLNAVSWKHECEQKMPKTSCAETFLHCIFSKISLGLFASNARGKKETQEKELIKENSLLDVWYYEAQPQYKYPVLQQETFILYVLVNSNFRISSW